CPEPSAVHNVALGFCGGDSRNFVERRSKIKSCCVGGVDALTGGNHHLVRWRRQRRHSGKSSCSSFSGRLICFDGGCYRHQRQPDAERVIECGGQVNTK